MAEIKKVTVKATGEEINVYQLRLGNYYDYDNMSADKPPSAIKAGKKEFKKDELIFEN